MGLLDPLWTAVFYAVVAVFFVGGLAFVRESVGLFRDVLAMVLTPTVDAGQVRQGRVEVSGTVRPGADTLPEPVSGERAVAYEYRIAKEKRLKDDLIEWTRWGYREHADGGEAVPFYVEDRSGRVRVEPGDLDAAHPARDGAVNLYATRDADLHVDGGEEPPERIRSAFDRAGESLPGDDRGRLFETARIEPGDGVYVLGTARFHDGERVIEGGDGRFVVASASQLRALVYNAGRGVLKLVGGIALSVVTGYVLLAGLADLLGVSLTLF